MSEIILTSQPTASGTPALGKVVIYPKDSGGLWYKTDAGVEVEIAATLPLMISVAGRQGVVVLTSADVGLSNVANEAAIPKSTLSAKGSLVGASALNTPLELVVGTNGYVLVADSSTASGLAWKLPPQLSAFRQISATDTFALTDGTIEATTGTYAVNLPTAVGITGKVFTIKNSGAGTITLTPNGAETIDGAATQVLATLVAMRVQSNGTNWIII